MKWVNVKRLTSVFFRDWAEFSLNIALARLLRDVPLMRWERRRRLYENAVLRYLNRKYGPIMERHQAGAMFPKEKLGNIVEPGNKLNIWVMWWQGEALMPPVVKACYRHLISNSGQDKVTLITSENVGRFVQLPPHILSKFDSGKMKLAHLSDVIRVMLLNQYGGLWIDATILTNGDYLNALRGDFFTLRKDGMFPEFIFRGKWLVSLLYLKYPQSAFASCMNEIFNKYWADHNDAVDYLFFDYLIVLMAGKIKSVSNAIDSVPETPGFYRMNMESMLPFQAKAYQSLFESAPFHKLTYRKDLPVKDQQGLLTNYGFLVSEKNER